MKRRKPRRSFKVYELTGHKLDDEEHVLDALIKFEEEAEIHVETNFKSTNQASVKALRH